MRLDHLTAEEIREIVRTDDPTAVLPTGSTEQHGPHLPLNTDIFLAESVAVAASEGIPAIVMPSVAYGYNEKELAFPGCVSLSARTFMDLIVDIGTSLRRTGWRRLMIVNGHGWNNDLIRAATHCLNETRGFTVACCSYWALCSQDVAQARESEIPGGMAHAGEFETSLMLHLSPATVRMERAKDEISYRKSEHHHHDLFVKSPVFLPEPFEDLSKSGVIGSPTLASKEKGKAWFEAAVENLRAFLVRFRTLYPANDS